MPRIEGKNKIQRVENNNNKEDAKVKIARPLSVNNMHAFDTKSDVSDLLRLCAVKEKNNVQFNNCVQKISDLKDKTEPCHVVVAHNKQRTEATQKKGDTKLSLNKLIDLENRFQGEIKKLNSFKTSCSKDPFNTLFKTEHTEHRSFKKLLEDITQALIAITEETPKEYAHLSSQQKADTANKSISFMRRIFISDPQKYYDFLEIVALTRILSERFALCASILTLWYNYNGKKKNREAHKQKQDLENARVIMQDTIEDMENMIHVVIEKISNTTIVVQNKKLNMLKSKYLDKASYKLQY